MNNFHYLARAVIMDGGKVLVAKAKGANNTFLPGGHIETGEKAQATLVREIQEEFGHNASVKGFYGAIEHSWTGKAQNFEINLVFNVDVTTISCDNPPLSQEGHLEFIWLKPDELEANNLQPSPVIELIKNIVSYRGAFWASTL